jgi:hypothetical protein
MRLNLKSTIISAVILGLLFLGCGKEVKEIRLAYKFKPGQKNIYSNQIKSNSRIYEGKNLVSRGELAYRSVLTEEILSTVDSTSARIRLTDISVRPNPGNNDSTDSDSISHKWSLEYLMNSDGKIIEIFPQNPEGSEWLEYYKNYYEQALPVLPDFAVTPGYSWSQTVKLIVRNEGATRVETTYRLKALAREAGYDCAVIEYEGELILPYRRTEKGAVTIERLDKAKTKGVIYFAYKEGSIIRQDESYEIESAGNKISKTSTVPFKSLSKRSSSMVLTGRTN